MEEKYLICYKFKGMSKSDRVKFLRALFGYNEQSHKGKYHYRTEGALEKYEKPIRSVIITNKKEFKKAVKILKQFNAELFTYKAQRIKA